MMILHNKDVIISIEEPKLTKPISKDFMLNWKSMHASQKITASILVAALSLMTLSVIFFSKNISYFLQNFSVIAIIFGIVLHPEAFKKKKNIFDKNLTPLVVKIIWMMAIALFLAGFFLHFFE